jgi:hypothetical protein
MEKMVEDFYAGREKEALPKIAQLVEGLSWIAELLEYTKPFQSEKMPAQLLFITLQEQLQVLEDALEYQDWIQLADCLQYQVIPLMGRIKELAQVGSQIL